MIVSVLHLVLTIRALLRSLSDRFLFGIVGGLARATLIVFGAIISFKQATLILLPGLTLRNSASLVNTSSLAMSVGILLVRVIGPALTLALLWVSWKRYQDVPAAEEEGLRRSFNAWLPVGILDAIYVVISVGAALMAEPP